MLVAILENFPGSPLRPCVDPLNPLNPLAQNLFIALQSLGSEPVHSIGIPTCTLVRVEPCLTRATYLRSIRLAWHFALPKLKASTLPPFDHCSKPKEAQEYQHEVFSGISRSSPGHCIVGICRHAEIGNRWHPPSSIRQY